MLLKKLTSVFSYILISISIVTFKNLEAQWTSIPTFQACWDVVTIQENVFIVARLPSGIETLYRSTTNGSTWVQIYPYSVVADVGNPTLVTNGTILYAVAQGPGHDTLLISSTLGDSWTKINTFPGVNINAKFERLLYANGNTMFARFRGNSVSEIYKSTDNGASWNLKLTSGGEVNRLSLIDNVGIASYNSAGYNLYSYISVDGGETWNEQNYGFKSLAKIGSVFFASYPQEDPVSSIYKSTNNGINWTKLNSSYHTGGYSILNIGNKLFSAGFYERGSLTGNVYQSTNQGLNWIDNGNYGLTFLWHLTNNSNYFFATQALSYNLIRRPYYEIVDVTENIQNQPEQFYLNQNFPNPFNPTTNIEFTLDKKQFVKLRVFDILGKEVATLFNENLSAGSYETDFEGSNLTSGVYFYILETGNHTEVKKMTLLK